MPRSGTRGVGELRPHKPAKQPKQQRDLALLYGTQVGMQLVSEVLQGG